MSDNKSKNAPDNERDILRQRFVKSEFEGFKDYEILELVLSYAIPRKDKDNKQLAKKLIAHFGSVSKVLDADIELLKEFPEISKNAATLLKMVPAILQIYVMDFGGRTINLRTPEGIADMIPRLFLGRTTEVLKAIYLNDKYDVVGYDDICCVDSTARVPVNINKIIAYSRKYHSDNVIIAHNHPQASSCPSEDDIRSTRRIVSLLSELDMNMVDHVIFSNLDQSIYSIQLGDFIKNKASFED